MRTFAAFRIAFRALARNKTRAALTMLGVIFGVGAVITTVSLGDGARLMVREQVATLGENLILISAGNYSRGGVSYGAGNMPTLTPEDLEAIRREIPGVRHVSPVVYSSRQVIGGGQNAFTMVSGVAPEYFAIRSWTPKDGILFTGSDVNRVAKVALIGKTVSTALFNGGVAVGQVVRIGNVPFTIVGELHSKGTSAGGTDYDDCVIVPYTSAMKRLFGLTSFRIIALQTESMEIMSEVGESIRQLLRQTHGIPDGREDDFYIRTQEEIESAMSQNQETMRYLLAGVAVVSLLVGGIGIMNIMLVSVTERTREIGIRMALGARTRDVLAQFLIEAVTLSCTGGVIGIAVGMAASKILTAAKNWPTLTSPEAMVVAFLFSVLMGVFFGFYPARKASRLDPIEALRYE